MGRKPDLSVKEKECVTRELANGKSTLQIAKILQRDHRTVKKYVAASHHGRKKRVQPKFRKLNGRQLRQIHRQVVKTPLATSRQVFDACDMPNVCRATRCKALREVASVMNAVKNPPLNQRHKTRRIQWARQYMKVDFSRVIFTDECRATLDGPDGWARGWVSSDHSPPVRMSRQQGGGGVMFWAAIISDTLIGPFRVEDGVKINATTYSAFLDRHFRPWWKKQPLRLRKTLLFMHDNAPAHAARYTTAWLKKIGIKDDNLMIWPPCSPDLNPIENLWSMLKKEVYVAGKQYNSIDELWNAITIAANNVTKDSIKVLTSSVDSRLLSVIKRDGGYINH